ncbi:MAG: xanthine dehydrogenase accessory protein XdhC [Cocleimonas sp.]
MNWIDALSLLKSHPQDYVLITVLETKGSSPRDTGSKMVVTADQLFDTIGGGALEHESIKMARQFLAESQGQTQQSHCFNLGKDLKQCCGGVVKVFFEIFPACHFNIVIFGAGHIGKALIKILEGVDCQVKWFDSRPEQFSGISESHIEKLVLTQADIAVESCHENSYYLVMTHDHALDQELCEAILSRKDSAYCGLIGSSTKGLKFRQRLMKKGYAKEELEQLSCPTGLSHLNSKIPMEIAVSMMAELLVLRDARAEIIYDTSSVVKYR